MNPDNDIVLAVWNTKHGQRSVFGNEYCMEELVQECESKILVAHNAKFEIQWMVRAGLDCSKVICWDTLIAEYVFAGNTNVPLDLGSVAKSYGLPGKEAFVDMCIKGGVDPEDIPKSFLERRCRYDVNVTEAVFKAQYTRAVKEGKLGVILTRCLLTPVLADMETKGMAPSPDRVYKAFEEVTKQCTDIQLELGSLHPGVNWNSPKQLGVLLYDELGFPEVKDRKGVVIRTPGGGRKADASTITALKAKTKAQKHLKALILEEALLSTKLAFLTKLKNCCDNEGILHARFNQTITKTHRLSSSGTKYKIQFQNMAREYKRLFKARHPGWLVGVQDGAQLEFRVAAFLGQDEVAMSDLRNDVDVHAFTRDTITAAGQTIDRQVAKAHTFKPLFGGTSGTKAEKAYYSAFKEKYAGVASAQQGWIDSVLRNKKLKTCTGLEFFWPNTRMSGTGYVENTASICNYPVQSLATADIIPIAVVYMWHRMRALGLESFIVNTIHDSIIMEVKPEEKEEIQQLGVDSFTVSVYNYLKAVYSIEFNVPLGIGSKYAEHWSEGEEVKINVEPSNS